MVVSHARKGARIGQVSDRSPRDQVRLLHEVFGFVNVAGFDKQVGEHKAGASPNQFLKRRAISAPAALHQGFVGFTCHICDSDRSDDNRTPRGAKSFRRFLHSHGVLGEVCAAHTRQREANPIRDEPRP